MKWVYWIIKTMHACLKARTILNKHVIAQLNNHFCGSNLISAFAHFGATEFRGGSNLIFVGATEFCVSNKYRYLIHYHPK